MGDKAVVPDELAYGRAPRAVDYQPYSLKDYTERNYDAKKATGYWQLGKLGPDLESSELQAKVGFCWGGGEGKGRGGWDQGLCPAVGSGRLQVRSQIASLPA